MEPFLCYTHFIPSTSHLYGKRALQVPCGLLLGTPLGLRVFVHQSFCCLDTSGSEMPPPPRRPQQSRSRSRGDDTARPSSAPPLTTYSFTPQRSLSRLPPPCPGGLCFDCTRMVPVQELQTVETRCCEYRCARRDSIDLCLSCFSSNWELFIAESGTMVGLTEEQIMQGFSIWAFHKNHCR